MTGTATEREMALGLPELAGVWQVPCGPAEVEALGRYAELLLTWSRKINLTGATSGRKLLDEHLPDSFALASALGAEERVVDVGSGGGLPAVPLAVLRPGLRITLVEPVAKKAAFLRTAVRELGLGGRVVVDTRRAEALVAGGVRFDAATARAVLAPEAWARLGADLVRLGGRVFVLASAEPKLQVPGLRASSSCSYLGGRRWLVGLEREA